MLNKYLNLCAGGLGISLASIGVTILFRGSGGANAKSLVAGSCLLFGGSGIAISRLCQAQIDLENDRILEEKRKATPKTCRGCRNFHGVQYGGVMLVCGMHPSGVEGNTCPDFEKFNQKGKR